MVLRLNLDYSSPMTNSPKPTPSTVAAAQAARLVREATARGIRITVKGK